MKNSITHLPEQIQSDLNHITSFLVRDYEGAASHGTSNKQRCANITNIILHGCFTEDHWQPDTEVRPGIYKTEVSYSYSILILVTKILPDTLYQVKEVERQLNRSGDVEHVVELQIETVAKLNKLLKDGYLLYDQIKERGILLYNNGAKGRNLLHMPDQPTAAKHYLRAKGHFNRTFPLAQSFLSGAVFYKDTNHNTAAFMLNVSAEQAYEAFMLVHTLYYPYSRTLTELRELSESIHQELQFVWAGREGRKSFFKLKCAFKGPRYTADYKITRAELTLLFNYVKELHKLVHYICKLKLETLKSGILKKPNKAWLEIIGEVLTYPEDGAITDDIEPTLPDPSPIIRTAAQEEAFVKLGSTIFDLEEPCYELEKLGSVLKAMAYGDDDAELSGLFVMGRIVQERAVMVKDIFKQMVDLLKQTRLRGDTPIKRKANTGLKPKELGL